MSDPLYGKALLRLAANAIGAGRLAEFDAQATMYNPTCGDRILVTLRSDETGRIAALGHETHACVLTQASASILATHACGMDLVRLRALREEVTGMLRGDGGVTAPFQDYEVLKPAAIYRNRHICILLPIDAALEALGQE